MRALISTTALAATALLLAGCEKKAADPAADANNSASSSLAVPSNEVDPDVDDNSFGIPELAPGNVVQNSEDPAVNTADER
jgi:hypothetical protein